MSDILWHRITTLRVVGRPYYALMVQAQVLDHVCLVREPHNPHHARAVRVDHPKDGQLGHLTAKAADIIGPMMDVGVRFKAHLASVCKASQRCEIILFLEG